MTDGAIKQGLRSEHILACGRGEPLQAGRISLAAEILLVTLPAGRPALITLNLAGPAGPAPRKRFCALPGLSGRGHQSDRRPGSHRECANTDRLQVEAACSPGGKVRAEMYSPPASGVGGIEGEYYRDRQRRQLKASAGRLGRNIRAGGNSPRRAGKQVNFGPTDRLSFTIHD